MNDLPIGANWLNLPAKSPAFYDLFFGPLFFEPYAMEVAKRIDPALKGIVLEIAAGTGRVTRHLRQRIAPAAKLIASDISKDMLDEAKKKLGHLAIEWQHADAAQLPFNDNSTDLVVCCFGYMFVADKPRALAEAYRVLKPGARLLFTTWDKLEHNPASQISLSIAKEYVKDFLPTPDNTATSMWDESLIQSLLQEAGFSKIAIEKVEQVSTSPTAKEAAWGFVKGSPYYTEIEQHNPGCIDELTTSVETAFADKFGAAPMIAPISAIISQAWK